MPQFKIGGKIVAIYNGSVTNAVGQTVSIKKGDEHTVYGIRKCECGLVALDIGVVSVEPSGYTAVSLCECKRKTETRIWWINSVFFIPIDEAEFMQVEYTKVIDEMPVGAN